MPPSILPLLQDPTGGGSSFLIMIALIGLLFFFMILRPQQKERKNQEAMRGSLKKGDRVMTQGGIIASVNQVKDNEVVLDLEGTARMRVVKAAVVQRLEESTAPAEKAAPKGAS